MESLTQSAESAALVADIDHPTPNGVWARAYETFGDEGKALHWMQTPRDIPVGIARPSWLLLGVLSLTAK